MCERRRGHEPQRPTAGPPPVAEVAILGARTGKRRVEAAQFAVGGAAAEDVVARQKVGGCLIGVEVLVDQVDDHLTGRGEEVIRETVARDATH